MTRFRRQLAVAITGLGVGVCSLLITGFIASIWWHFGVTLRLGRPYEVRVSRGALWFIGPDPASRGSVLQWHAFRRNPSSAPFEWLPEYAKEAGWYRGPLVLIPAWLGLLAAAGPTCWMWRRAQRHGGCAKCGYDLTGLEPEARCPECGEGETAPVL